MPWKREGETIQGLGTLTALGSFTPPCVWVGGGGLCWDETHTPICLSATVEQRKMSGTTPRPQDHFPNSSFPPPSSSGILLCLALSLTSAIPLHSATTIWSATRGEGGHPTPNPPRTPPSLTRAFRASSCAFRDSFSERNAPSSARSRSCSSDVGAPRYCLMYLCAHKHTHARGQRVSE